MNDNDYRKMQQILMEELRLYHYPVAVKYFFTQNEIEAFKDKAEFYVPVKPMTFCQWEIAARMKGQTVFAVEKDLGCSNAKSAFGWKPLDAKEIKSHLRYAKDLAQAERFAKSKPQMPEGKVLAVVVGPLGDAVLPPSTVHFYCDNMQAYHLAVDWMAATDIHPLKTNVTVNSAACGGNIHSFLSKTANMLPACSGSYHSGKTERGETNFVVPGEHIKATVERLLERKKEWGSSALARPGDHFPGADVCKNCSLIVFKKEKKERVEFSSNKDKRSA